MKLDHKFKASQWHDRCGRWQYKLGRCGASRKIHKKTKNRKRREER